MSVSHNTSSVLPTPELALAQARAADLRRHAEHAQLAAAARGVAAPSPRHVRLPFDLLAALRRPLRQAQVRPLSSARAAHSRSAAAVPAGGSRSVAGCCA